MMFLLACWCLLITLHQPLPCKATVFEKRKPKLKYSYESDETSDLLDYRSPIPLSTQRNIITKILYDLKRGHKSDRTEDLTDSANDVKEDSALLPDINSFITERSVEYKKLPDDAESESDAHTRRRDYISNLPKPKKEMIDSILNNAVSQIFSKVIPGAQSDRSNDTYTIAEVGAIASKNNIPVANATLKNKIPAADTNEKGSSSESKTKSTIASYAKRKDVNKKDVVGSQQAPKSDKSAINDTLLEQIDAVTLTTGDDAVKMEKDVVNNFERPIDQPDEQTSTVNDVGRNWMPREDEVAASHDTSHDMGSQFENDDEPPATNKGNRRSEYFYDPNAKDVGLTNEVDDEENFTPSLREVQRHAEKHNLNLFQEPSTVRSRNAYRKHRVSPPSEDARNEDDKSLGDDYGTLFVKDSRGVKQLNFYNSDLHLAATVNSSESRLNAMKAVATVLKELGGLTFEEEDEGVVSKAQFDKLMVDADEEDEPLARSTEKAKRPNSPLNERQVKIAKFRDYTAPYIAHPIQGYDPHNPYTPHHLRPHLLRVGQEEPRGEEGGDGEEDAINYYQKNRPRDGDRAIDGEERESLIPVGPISEINTKGKIAAIQKGDLVTLKGIRKTDRTAAVVGNTREEIGSSSDLTTDETPIPAVIHVDYNQLDNPRTFEKIFTDRVLLAPVIDKGPGSRIKKGNVTTSAQLHGEVNAKKRHLPKQRKQERAAGPIVARPARVVEHSVRTKGVGQGILVTPGDVAKSRDDKEKFYFHKLSVNNIGAGENENVHPVKVTR